MAKLGDITEFCLAEEFRLDVGSDTYVTLLDMGIFIADTEDRETTNDDGPNYFSGMGDNFFTATLKLTHPELSSLNTLQQKDSDGKKTSTAWKIIGKFLEEQAKPLLPQEY